MKRRLAFTDEVRKEYLTNVQEKRLLFSLNASDKEAAEIMSTFQVKYHAKEIWELSSEAETITFMQQYPNAKHLGTVENSNMMSNRREQKLKKKQEKPKADDAMDLNEEPVAKAAGDDTYVKLMFSKAVSGVTDNKKQIKSLMSASHIDLYKRFCILHFVTGKAAENAC